MFLLAQMLSVLVHGLNAVITTDFPSEKVLVLNSFCVLLVKVADDVNFFIQQRLTECFS